MRVALMAAALAAGLVGAAPLWAAEPAVPAAVFTDPAPDKAYPARSEVLHIPAGGVQVNGLAYIAAGVGLHPTLVLFHGLPGNEKNLDLAQAVRRAGWNVVTLNYRGSWGSPGRFSFAGNLEDARAALAYVRDPANAKRLQVETRRLVVGGHSMGGWVTALTAGEDPDLAGAILISAADMGRDGAGPRAEAVALMADNMEALSGVTAESMADEVIAKRTAFGFMRAAPGLAKAPLLVLSADDGLAPQTDALAAAVRKAGGAVTTTHVATDHSWNTARVRLASEVIGWLRSLPKR
jgi:pimeloyl-ACP methyl ester carboxylesterase